MVLLLSTGCARKEQETNPSAPVPVTSHLSGQIISASAKTGNGNEGFEVTVVFSGAENRLDTLGHAVTDASGAFQMVVKAPEEGVYPLIIARDRTIYKMGDLVVAEGDTATLRATMPMPGARPLIVRSRQNAAWLAFKNTRQLHSQAMMGLAARRDSMALYDIARTTVQSVSILWGLQDTYPGTLGGDLAAAQSITMLEGLDDSALVARARTITPERAGFTEVARAARRAQARMRGLDASIEMIDEFVARAPESDVKAELHSEYVGAYMDFGKVEEAKKAARNLADRFPESDWAQWSRNALYDLEHLVPGMTVPDLMVTTREGDRFNLRDLRGSLVLLEFYKPQNAIYQEELALRNDLVRGTAGIPFSVVSVSMEPDTSLNNAFARLPVFPGIHAIIPDTSASGRDIAQRFNLHLLPRRILIDPQGKILSKYDGRAMTELQNEVAMLLNRNRPAS